MLVLEIILAFLLPPLPVALRSGLSIAFWISLLLTLIAWLPGVLFALVTVLRPDLLPTGWVRRPLIG